MTNDHQVLKGFDYFADFLQFLPGTNFIGGSFKKLIISVFICLVKSNHLHLWSVGDERKFVLINNIFGQRGQVPTLTIYHVGKILVNQRTNHFNLDKIISMSMQYANRTLVYINASIILHYKTGVL